MNVTKKPTSVAAIGATLGEGPVWVARDSALWFVDIKSPAVHRLDPATGMIDHWKAPKPVGWVLPAKGGGFLAGLQGGLYRFDPDGGGFTKLCDVEPDYPDNRLNDAALDSAGRVWFGSMHNGEVDATGRLYHYVDGAVTDAGTTPITITNGPAVAPDGRTLYAVDTLGRRLDAYTIDDRGLLTDKRTFLELGEDEPGFPDGAVCDREGGVWVAFFGGSCARRYAPGGECTDTVEFPVPNITKIAIGGADGRTAYATTARWGMSDEALARHPEAGNVFAFTVDIPGEPVGEVTI